MLDLMLAANWLMLVRVVGVKVPTLAQLAEGRGAPFDAKIRAWLEEVSGLGYLSELTHWLTD